MLKMPTGQISETHFASDDDLLTYAHINYPIDIREFKDFVEVAEEGILKAWITQERTPEIEHNDYAPIIYRANFFIKHGLTPVYFAEKEGLRMLVTSEEFLNRKFN